MKKMIRKKPLTLFSSVLMACAGWAAQAVDSNEEALSSQINPLIEAGMAKASQAPHQPQLVTVAKKVEVSQHLRGQLKATTLNANSGDAAKLIINKIDASFIKIHFSAFQIPQGSYLKISNYDGTQVFQYGATDSSAKTLNESLNDDGVERFSALSILGDTAIIELIGNGASGDYNIAIDHIMQGFPQQQIEMMMSASPIDGVDPLSTCGVNERKDVACWANSHPTEYERTRPVARLLINGSGLCTAWRVGDGNHMFTNNHCVGSQSDLTNTEVWFNYQNTACGGNNLEQTTIVTGNTLYKTDYTLDYTLFSVNDFNSIASFGYFGLDVRDAVDQEQIYIPQHGSGNPKELSIESDQNAGGVCRIDDVVANGRGTDTDMGYLCDTIGGSSGSPVLATSTNNVLALHHFGGCNNQGVRINQIWPQVSSYFGGEIPTGDNGNTSGEPTANFSYVSDQLSVNFSDQSSDADGTIVSYFWDFGDGNSSSQTNPAHTYASAGTYDVVLTVTDNDGLNASHSESVSVVVSQQGELVKGVAVSGLAGNQGDMSYFWIDVPAGASDLTFDISGGSGDADLYVRSGAEPTTSTYDCRPYRSGNTENCSFAAPDVDRYYVMIRAYSTYSGVSLVANYSEVVDPADGINETNVSAAKGEWQHFVMTVDSGAASLNVQITGGTGDADLYVRQGAEPTTSSYDCRPYKWGNEETCTISNPQAGAWYVSVRAYSAFSGLTVTATAN